MNLLDHFYLIWVAVILSVPDHKTRQGAVGIISITWVCELVYKTWFM